jgi:hypothetical protein
MEDIPKGMKAGNEALRPSGVEAIKSDAIRAYGVIR